MATAIAPYDALTAYENAAAAYDHLTTDTMVARAAAAIDTAIRAHKAPAETLATAIGVTRGTLYHWRRLKRHISPAQAHRIALAFCAPTMPTDPAELDQLPQHVHDDAATLFNLFYSDDQRDAVNWLTAHRPTDYTWATAA